MKGPLLLFVVVLIGLFLAGPASALAQKKTPMGGHVALSADDLKWDSLKGAPPGSGVMSALLWGNPEKGPFGMFVKFPAGFKMPLHYHSSALKAVVVKGAYIYVPEKGEEKVLGPGSYYSYPAKDRHATKSAEDSETILYVEGTGKFDAIPIEAGK
jgi:quercetin dioxygenase-like cupin family protein